MGTTASILLFVLAGVLGLAVGSFVNCWAWRKVNGESVVSGRSHCASCNHELGAGDLVPLFSWLFLRGRCRYCGEHISFRYPAAELACAAAFIAILAVYGATLEAVQLMAFSAILLFLTLTDIDRHLIPDGCIIAAVAVRAAYIAAVAISGAGDWVALAVSSLIGGNALGLGVLVIVLIGDRVLGRPSMGWGDVKLFAVAGLYFGWIQGIFLVAVACVFGLVFAVVSMMQSEPEDGDDTGSGAEDDPDGMLSNGKMIPFGPSIAAACIVTMLVGKAAVGWYLSLFV